MPPDTVNSMKRLRALPVAAAILSLLAADAAADLKSGREKLVHGDYAGARTELAAARGKERPEARLLLVRVHQLTGSYAEAEKLARELSKSPDPALAADGAVALAEVLRLRGDHAGARAVLEPVVAADDTRFAARRLLGVVYLEQGDRDKAKEVFEGLIDEWRAGRLTESEADQVFILAEAARYTDYFEDANGWYRDAVAMDPNLFAANLEWGQLFLSKYAAAYAGQSFDEVLKINPRHPDAHAGMALVKLEQSYDLAAAMHHLEQALEVNDKHLPSLAVRATIEIDKNEWDAARKTLEQILAVNPNHLEARSLLATIHWLRDDTRAYEAEKKKVFAVNPRYAEFFHIVARSAVREHRYDEAIKLELEAVQVDPTYYEAMQALGTGYLRLGQEKEGIEWLRKAWEGDEYNVRTYNTLDLFESIIPAEYSFERSKSFKVRYHNAEKPILRRYIEPLLEQAFAVMVDRYAFTPKLPLVIELFQDPDHYSVRTVGLPNLGALGVCFGQVITAMSPSNGEINWGMVLWHELAHAFHIQMSDSRVPRWFTEGLAEYETLVARPEWRRENDADLYAAMADGNLPSVVELNYGFMKPSMQEVVVAYYLSAVTIEYIASTYGFDAVKQALGLFGKGKETPEVIETITGKKVVDFDTEFRTWLKKRLAPYENTFRLPLSGFDDLTELEVAVDARPDDTTALADLALGHFYDGDAPAAGEAAEKVLAADPKNKVALYITAELALRAQDVDEARKQYLALIAAGGDGFDVRGRLGMIARHAGDAAEAERQLCAAKKLDPERSYPYMELAEMYFAAGRDDEALRELETYVFLEQMQYAPVKRLVDEYYKRGTWDKVRTFGQMAVFINPADGELLMKLADAQLELDAADDALYTYDSVLLLDPRRPALAHIGRTKAYQAKGDKWAAKKALAKALKIEPENKAALELKKQLR